MSTVVHRGVRAVLLSAVTLGLAGSALILSNVAPVKVTETALIAVRQKDGRADYGLGAGTGAVLLDVDPFLGVAIYRVPEDVADDVLIEGYNDPAVLWVERERNWRIYGDPKHQWFHERVGDAVAWQAGISGAGIRIGVVDTGVECSHPEIHCVGGTTAVHWDRTAGPVTADRVRDAHGHGTMVAGTAAGVINGQGGEGIAPQAEIVSGSVCDSGGNCSDLLIGRAITHIASSVKVINLSLGGPFMSQYVCDAIDYAQTLGVVVVAAAGNDGNRNPQWPASCKGVIAVGATDQNDRLTDFSQKNGVDLVAPGVDIFGPSRNKSWTTWDGTSFSAPIVAGAAALVRQAAPQWNPAQVAKVLQDKADRVCGPVVDPAACGWGRVNVGAAVSAAGATPTPTSTRAATRTRSPATATPSCPTARPVVIHAVSTLSLPFVIRPRPAQRVVRTTAYTACDPGMDCRGITFSGTKATEGRTAAAGEGWPIGTVLCIDGLGARIVEDRGRLGVYDVDVYFDRLEDALAWGAKPRAVWAADDASDCT